MYITKASAARSSLGDMRSTVPNDAEALREQTESAIRCVALLCAALHRHDQLTYEEIVTFVLWSLMKHEGTEPVQEGRCADGPIHQSLH